MAQGIVVRQRAGNAYLYRLNRDHVAAQWIERLAGLRQQLLKRIRGRVGEWSIQPVAAAVFGSVARGDAGPESDLDLFVVRPTGVDEAAWDGQVAELAKAVTGWTGNDARALEFHEDELRSGGGDEPVIKAVLNDGIEVGGSLKALRRLI